MWWIRKVILIEYELGDLKYIFLEVGVNRIRWVECEGKKKVRNRWLFVGLGFELNKVFFSKFFSLVIKLEKVEGNSIVRKSG